MGVGETGPGIRIAPNIGLGEKVAEVVVCVRFEPVGGGGEGGGCAGEAVQIVVLV